MQVRYKNTSDDFAAFNTFHFAHSPTHKRMVAIYVFVFGLALGVAVFFLAKSFPLESVKSMGEEVNNTSAAIQAVFVAAIYAFFLPRILRRNIARQSRKLLREGRNKTFLCEHQLEITEDGLVTRTPYSESKASWEAIERIARTEAHTFVYVSAVSALVIPHDRVLEGDCEAFVSEVRKRMSRRAEAASHD